MPISHSKVAIVGTGTVGAALARALFEKGYTIVCIINRTGSSAIKLAHELKCRRVSTSVSDIVSDIDILIVTVPDDSIHTLAIEISKNKKLKFKNITAIHCSGVHTSEILLPIKKRGSLVASMHPIQTFPDSLSIGKSHHKFKGIFFGVEGGRDAIPKIEKIVHDLDGYTILIPKEMKALYHVACVFASNYMATFLNAVNEIAKQLNLRASWTEVFGPLMTTTMGNVVKASASSALTGPIVRGDLDTIEIHLKTLIKYAPQFIPLYTISGIEAARIAKDSGRVTQEYFNEIISKFRKFIKTSSITKITKVKR